MSAGGRGDTWGMARKRTLERPRRGQGRIIAGVCAAIADRLGTSRFLVRVLFVIFGFVGAGEIAYIVLWILIPRAPR
jgi:phage shock protein C